MKRRNTVYVLSFDGVPMSGLLVESFKLLSATGKGVHDLFRLGI